MFETFSQEHAIASFDSSGKQIQDLYYALNSYVIFLPFKFPKTKLTFMFVFLLLLGKKPFN